jgi:proline iminopeptidase
MKRESAFFIFLLSLGLAALVSSCSNPDVRLGMGDGAGVRLSYRSIGKGPPVVVIHDGPGFEKRLMFGGFDPLASDLRVIYYDQRGCGKSQPISPVVPSTLEANVEDLESLRRYFHLPQMSLAAHGWGAVLAIEYARKYGKYVDSIILITPLSPFSPGPRIERVLDALSPEDRHRILQITNHPTLSMVEKREGIMRAIMPLLFYRKEGLDYVDLSEIRYAPDVSIRLNEDLKSVNVLSMLGRLNVPTLVVAGRHDIFTPMMDQMAYADGIPASSAIVFNDSGHFPFLEQRELFIRVAKEFLLHGQLPALVWVREQ